MKIGPSLAFLWVGALKEPSRAAELLAKLEVSGKAGLLERMAELGSLLSQLTSRAFVEGGREAIPALEAASSALEDLHAFLLPAPDLPLGGEQVSAWHMFCVLASSILGGACGRSRELVSSSLSPGELRSWAEGLAHQLKGLRGLLEDVHAFGPDYPAHGLLEAVSSRLPGEVDLAALLVLPGLARGLRKDKEAFPELLAELIWKGLSEGLEGTEDGCLRLADVLRWTSRLLGMELKPEEVRKALRSLKAKGLLTSFDEKTGLAILRPRERDIKAAFEFARRRCRHGRAGLRKYALAEGLGWHPEYASAVINELVDRGLLVSSPNSWLPVSEEQARSLLIEAESCFEAELLEEAAKLYQLASTLFTKLSERAEGEKLELFLAEASYCDFMKAYCDARILYSSLDRAATTGLELNVADLDRLKVLVRAATKCLNEALRRLSALASSRDPEVSRAASEVVDLIDKKADKFKEFRSTVSNL